MPLDGPRLKPRSGPAKQLIVLLTPAIEAEDMLGVRVLTYGSAGSDLAAMRTRAARHEGQVALVVAV